LNFPYENLNLEDRKKFDKDENGRAQYK